MSDKYFWVIGGGSLQVPVCQKVKEMGLKVIVSDMNPSCDCRGYADIFYEIDIFDVQKHCECAAKFMEAHDDERPVGVLAAGIDANVTHSVLDAYFDHNRTAPIRIATMCHEKGKFREAQLWLGHKHPLFQLLFDPIDIHWFIRRNDLKSCLIKAPSNSAGRGMTMITEEDNFKLHQEAFNKAVKDYAIAEEVLEGTEHTVETMMFDGKFYPCFITDRRFSKVWSSLNDKNVPMIEFGLRNPTTLPPWKQDGMYRLAHRMCIDFGILNGAMKVDMMDTKEGPVAIEATTRLSGGFDCQYLVPAATGQDIVKAAIYNALGSQFKSEFVECLKKTKDRVALSRSMWIPPGKKIVKIDDLKARSLEGVELIYWRYKEGDVVEPYVDSSKRVNFIITSGQDEMEAGRVMETAIDSIHVEVE